MKDAPAFDLYPERWTHGTRHMSKVERCDYMDLLCHQWTDDGLPADLNILARLVGYKKGAQIPALVLEKFPIASDGKRRNERLESERQKQRKRIDDKAKGAAITNAKRWGKPIADESLSDQSATLERVASESPPLTTHPVLLFKSESTPVGVREEDDEHPIGIPSRIQEAEAIVNIYRRRDAPRDCIEAVLDAIILGDEPNTIRAQVAECVQHITKGSPNWSNRYIPTAKKFFTDQQWRSPEAFATRWQKPETHKPRNQALQANHTEGMTGDQIGNILHGI